MDFMAFYPFYVSLVLSAQLGAQQFQLVYHFFLLFAAKIWLRYGSSDVSRAADGTSGDDFSLKWEINHSSFCGLWLYIINLLVHRIISTEIWTRILTNILLGDQKSEHSWTWGVPRHIFLLWSVNWFIVMMIKNNWRIYWATVKEGPNQNELISH